jgi:hypothetical protein
MPGNFTPAAMVSEVQEHEAPIVGSFGSVDSGEKKKEVPPWDSRVEKKD